MVLLFTILLGVSITGMVLLLSVKRYELNNGRVLFVSIRPTLSSLSHRLSFLIGRVFPALVRNYALLSKRGLATLLHNGVARATLLLEFTLEKVLHVVREKTTSERPAGEASAFLREVADHKKKLLKRSKSNRIILDE